MAGSFYNLIIGYFMNLYGLEKKPEIALIWHKILDNSEIYKIKIHLDNRDKYYIVKMLQVGKEDGRTNRSDFEFKKLQIIHEYEILNSIYRYFENFEYIGAIRPIACFPDDLIIITEFQDGVKLQEYLKYSKFVYSKSKHEKLKNIIGLCGNWLKYFHSYTDHNYPANYYDDIIYRAITYCEYRLISLNKNDNNTFDTHFIEAIRKFISTCALSMKEKEIMIVGNHNDYGPHNIIVFKDKIFVLDLSGFSYGPKCNDYIQFWSRIDILKSSPFVSNAYIERLQDYFSEYYGDVYDKYNSTHSLYRISFILDKMSDIKEDWNKFKQPERYFYGLLYGKYINEVRHMIFAG